MRIGALPLDEQSGNVVDIAQHSMPVLGFFYFVSACFRSSLGEIAYSLHANDFTARNSKASPGSG
jgi:hypothetical protein